MLLTNNLLDRRSYAQKTAREGIRGARGAKSLLGDYYASKPILDTGAPSMGRGGYLQSPDSIIQDITQDLPYQIGQGLNNAVRSPVDTAVGYYEGLKPYGVAVKDGVLGAINSYREGYDKSSSVMPEVRENAFGDARNKANDYLTSATIAGSMLASEAMPWSKAKVLPRVAGNSNPDFGPTGRISTRVPTAVSAVDDPMTGGLTIDTQSMMQANAKGQGATLDKNLDFIKNQTWFKQLSNQDPQMATEAFDKMAGTNLDFIMDRLPSDYRDRSKLWYVGANRFADQMAKKFGVPRASMAGVIASLSPQKDWFMNASMAERVGDILTNHRNTPWSAEMSAMPLKYGSFVGKVKGKYKPVTKKNKDPMAQQRLWDSVEGKKFSDLETIDQKAVWLRAYDEAHNPKRHRSITPEGELGDWVIADDGKTQKALGWGSFGEIGKAIKSFESGGDFNIISDAMGTRHKVRNFFNNIEVPYSQYGDITVDTHAIAAAYGRPLSGEDALVKNGLGMTGGSSSISGAQGSYGLIADTYRRVAAEHGLLPRELQSITWEGIRGLFPQAFKNPENRALIDSVWTRFDNGEINQIQAMEQIEKMAGGFKRPVWLDDTTPKQQIRKGGSTMASLNGPSQLGLLA